MTMRALAVAAALAFWASGPLAAQPAGGKRYAVLVGVNEYDHPKLTPLKYAVNDVTELADVLRKQGYAVSLLTAAAGADDRKPTKARIDAAVKAVLGKCGKGDAVVVGMAGHGVQFEGKKDSYFCPRDGKPFAEQSDTLVSLGALYDAMDQSNAGIKVVMVDACRDDPAGGRGIDADNARRPPRGVACLFSCSAGERSFENDKLKHGVFFHHVIKGLNGEAQDRRGRVTFAGLAAYVSTEVAEAVPVLVGPGVRQSPNLKAEYSNEPVLVRTTVVVDPEAGKGDYRTVVDAVASAPEGATIKVRPGLYKGILKFYGSARIVGDGPVEKIVVEADDEAVVAVGHDQASEVYVKGLTLQCTAGTDGRKYGAVCNWGGKLTVEDCSITSNSLSSVHVNDGGEATFRRCKVSGGNQAGALVYNGGVAAFEECEFSSNSFAGIEVRNTAKVTLTKCRLKDNVQDGLRVYGMGEVVATECDFTGNGHAGVQVGTDGSATLTVCRITGNKGFGLKALKGGAATLVSCTIADNDGGRIDAHDEATVIEKKKP